MTYARAPRKYRFVAGTATAQAPRYTRAAVTHRPGRQLTLIAIAQLFAMTLWFSATAVLPQLGEAWGLSTTAAAWITAAVQLGFVIGALGSAILNLPDVIPPRRMVWMSSVAGAVLNLVLAWGVSSVGPAVALRFATGICLAGVYPPGIKIAAGHVSGRERGFAVGVLVGALTLGSATPHLVAGMFGGARISYGAVMTVSSALALAGALITARLVRDGPWAAAPAAFDPRQASRVLRDRAVLLANFGYFGHMWELYAMWTWLALFLTGALGRPAGARLAAFAIIGVAGCVGAIAGGLLADRVGRTTVTIGAMAISGACCALSPWAYVAPAPAILAFGLVWGAAAIADSAQFSAAITELSDASYIGTALTLQTSLGFALTLVPIWSLPYLAAEAGWRFAFLALAPGPALGCIAMAALRRRPEALRLAAGRR